MFKGRILIVEDDEKLRTLYTRLLSLEGYEVCGVGSIKDGIKALENRLYHLCLLDLRLPDGNGLNYIAKLRNLFPTTEIIIMTAYGSINDGVQAIIAGAANYLVKGDNDAQFLAIINNVVEKTVLSQALNNGRKQHKLITFEQMLGSDAAFIAVKEQALRVAKTEIPVLILGESGTGKEYFAQSIHQASNRKTGAFIALNCAAIPVEMLESELFGYSKGAFTGAIQSRPGLIREADHGTLFLDELGELPLGVQAKLLRVLESGMYYALGDNKPKYSDFRLICATHKNLSQMVANNLFREDLYYRIAVFELTLPALRQRTNDIELFVRHFIEIFAPKLNHSVKSASTAYIEKLKEYSWPGNIRELRNIVERSMILAQGSELTPDLLQLKPSTEIFTPITSGFTPSLNLEELEKTAIKQALTNAQGNKNKAAMLLGIAPSTLYRKLEQYKL